MNANTRKEKLKGSLINDCFVVLSEVEGSYTTALSAGYGAQDSSKFLRLSLRTQNDINQSLLKLINKLYFEQ